MAVCAAANVTEIVVLRNPPKEKLEVGGAAPPHPLLVHAAPALGAKSRPLLPPVKDCGSQLAPEVSEHAPRSSLATHPGSTALLTPRGAAHTPSPCVYAQALGVSRWPTWGCEVSNFPWSYDSTETCYVLKGRVVVTPDGGPAVEIAAGDMATFPSGMSCTWDVKEPILKHYNFS